MAESISIDSARLVLPHALFFESGKASLGFFEVVDSVSCLDSESKLSLDSESALHSALGLPSWRGVDSVGLLLQAAKLVFAVWLCKLCGFFGRLADKPSVPSKKSTILSHCKPAEPFPHACKTNFLQWAKSRDPIRTTFAPHAIAISKSSLIPIESVRAPKSCSESKTSFARTKLLSTTL